MLLLLASAPGSGDGGSGGDDGLIEEIYRMARNPIAAPPVQPPRYGLLVAAQTTIADGEWAIDGVSFDPEQCGNSGRVQIECRGNTAEMDANTRPTSVTADPFLVYASDRCSPFGFAAADYVARATRQLEATQSYEVAGEFWDGTLRDAADAEDAITDNPALIDATSDTVTNGESSPTVALAALEQGLAECSRGRRGMIHATPQVLVHWIAAQAVRIEGGQLISPMGNIVVADAGYSGDGPGGTAAGDTQWAYATGMISIRLSTPIITPRSIADAQELAGRLNRDDNTIDVYAQRVALVQWDECCHLAAEIDLPVALIGGAS